MLLKHRDEERQLGRIKVQSEAYISLIGVLSDKLSTATLEFKANRNHERRSTTTKPVIIARISAMLLSIQNPNRKDKVPKI